MGFFNYIFGSTSTQNNQNHSVSEVVVRKLVSRYKINTLTGEEEGLVEEEILKSRINGHISMKRIDEALIRLRSKKKISDNDRKGVLRVFEEYFERNSLSNNK